VLAVSLGDDLTNRRRAISICCRWRSGWHCATRVQQTFRHAVDPPLSDLATERSRVREYSGELGNQLEPGADPPLFLDR